MNTAPEEPAESAASIIDTSLFEQALVGGGQSRATFPSASPMEMHWQGFSLSPRDLFAQRPGVPDGREGLNGQPDTWQGEGVGDLRERDAGQFGG